MASGLEGNADVAWQSDDGGAVPSPDVSPLRARSESPLEARRQISSPAGAVSDAAAVLSPLRRGGSGSLISYEGEDILAERHDGGAEADRAHDVRKEMLLAALQSNGEGEHREATNGPRDTSAAPAAADAARSRRTSFTIPSAASRGLASAGGAPLVPSRRRIYPVGRTSTRPKWSTREIAALDFLLSIPMEQEQEVLRRARDAEGRGGGGIGGIGGVSDAALDPWADAIQAAAAGGAGGAAANLTSPARAPSNALGPDHAAGSAGTGVAAAFPAPAEDDDDSLTDADQQTEDGRDGAATAAARTGASPAPGRRLPGAAATDVRVPPAFRHRLSKLPGHQAAVVRQWEQVLTRQRAGAGTGTGSGSVGSSARGVASGSKEGGGLLEGRMFFSSARGYPLAVLSVVRYEPREEEARRRRQRWADARGAEVFAIPKRDWRGFSYAHLLRRGRSDGSSASNAGEAGGGGAVGMAGAAAAEDRAGTAAAMAPLAAAVPEEGPHVPGFLDDPSMTTGRHRHVTVGDSVLGPVVCSILLFVKPKDLKEELNRQFRERHPELPPSLTLSKIRSLKRQALIGCHRAGIEVSTVALACVYFERLCAKGIVSKANRRLSMACCLLLAYKFSEPLLGTGDATRGRLPALWALMDQEWQLSRKEVIDAEFGALVQLGFSLHADPQHVSYHFALLLKQVESNARDYLGDAMLRVHQQALAAFPGGNDDDEPGGSGGGGGGIISGSNRMSGHSPRRAGVGGSAGGGGGDSPPGGTRNDRAASLGVEDLTQHSKGQRLRARLRERRASLRRELRQRWRRGGLGQRLVAAVGGGGRADTRRTALSLRGAVSHRRIDSE